MGKYAMRKYINIICESETDWDAEMAQCDQTAKALTNGRKLKLSAPRDEDFKLFDRVREVIRHQEGLGGQCHSVSEWISHWYKWTQEAGTYCTYDGEPICTYHFWNELPDGAILDCTADQLGEDSRTIRYIKRRYTCEWCEDWHPEHPDYDPTWDREKRNPSKYSGVIDAERENDLMKKHGDQYWHLPKDQRQHINAYREKLKSYGDGTPDRTFD